MASRSAPPCTHELRPGIAVCLRCQHAERAAHRARQRRVFARGTAVTLGVAVIAAVAVAAAGALRSRSVMGQGIVSPTSGDRTTQAPSLASANPEPDSEVPAPANRSAVNDSIARLGATNANAPRAQAPSIVPVAATAAPQPAMASARGSRGVALLVPVGRTALRDTMLADRAGDTVRVSFDLVLSRTRRPDKFEA